MKTKDRTGNTLIDRYLYALSKRIPPGQKEDITREVRVSVEEMLQDMFPDAVTDENSVRTVLNKLGDPRRLADNYLGRRSYLIGPDFYSTYILILKIVVPVAAAGVTLAMILDGVFGTTENIIRFIAETIAAAFSAAVQAFAWVTVIFALVERFTDPAARRKMDEFSEPSGEWSVDDLPQIPEEKSVIRRSDPIVGIVFSIIFLILLNLAPQLIGIIIADNGSTDIIPLFDMNNFSKFLPVFNIILILGIFKETLRFFEGKYTIRSSVVIMFISAASIVMLFTAFKEPSLWNSGFITKVESVFAAAGAGSGYDLKAFLPTLYKILLGLGIFGFITETATNFYRSVRYR